MYSSPFQEFINWAARLLLAHSVVLALLLLNIVSFSLPHAGDFKPFFLLMAVYYWAIYRPTLLPVFYTFLLGLVMDSLSHLPMGLTSLILLILQLLVQRSRLFLMGQPYATVWMGFGIISVVYAFFLWLTLSLSGEFMPIKPAFVAMGLSVLIFPLVSLALFGIHKMLPMASDSMRTTVR